MGSPSPSSGMLVGRELVKVQVGVRIAEIRMTVKAAPGVVGAIMVASRSRHQVDEEKTRYR